MVFAVIRHSPLSSQPGMEDYPGPKSEYEENKAQVDFPQQEFWLRHRRAWKLDPAKPYLRDPQQLFVFWTVRPEFYQKFGQKNAGGTERI